MYMHICIYIYMYMYIYICNHMYIYTCPFKKKNRRFLGRNACLTVKCDTAHHIAWDSTNGYGSENHANGYSFPKIWYIFLYLYIICKYIYIYIHVIIYAWFRCLSRSGKWNQHHIMLNMLHHGHSLAKKRKLRTHCQTRWKARWRLNTIFQTRSRAVDLLKSQTKQYHTIDFQSQANSGIKSQDVIFRLSPPRKTWAQELNHRLVFTVPCQSAYTSNVV